MAEFISVELKNGDGGFFIQDTKAGRDIANDLLKNKKYVKGGVNDHLEHNR